MSNVMTILGTATGGGNAITDLSFDVNTLYLRKIVHLQRLTMMKLLQVKRRLIQLSTQSEYLEQIDAYTKTQDDALLLLKEDKTQLIDAYKQTEVDAFLDDKLNVSDQIDAYTKGEADNLLSSKANSGVSYIKEEDDALLLLKAEKTQLIDAYTKGETNNLLINKDNSGVSYTKGEDDALLLLKADKTQLIDAFTKGETNNLLNNKADSGVSYTKGDADNLLSNKANSGVSYSKTQDDALLLSKADKTQLIDSYTRGEDDALLLLKADKKQLIYSYSKREDDALLLLKSDKTQLIDSYKKGEADNLLNNKANSGISYTKGEVDALLLMKANQSTTYIKTKPDYLASQIDVGDVDLSGYMTLDTSQTITANKTFNNACRFISSIDGMATITGTQFVKSGADDIVVLLGAGGTKPLSEFASGSTIYGTKTFNSNVNATGFVKTGKDDASVLFADGGDRLLSSFGGIEDLTSSAFSVQDDVAVITYIPFPNNTVDKGGYVSITHSTGHITYAAGSSDFPELYAYIKERYPKPIGELPQPVPIGDQTLQQQVKNNDDIIYASNVVFNPPVPNAITKLDLSSQLERNSFLASGGSDPTLIVYGDRITLTASYATTGVFPNGYLFKSYPQEARPILVDQVIALDGTDASHTYTYNTFYIVDNGICKICVLNLYFESKGLNGRSQEVGRIPDSTLPADGKKPQESIPQDSDDVFKYCASEKYYL
ncbi:MAG: hypothetical protein EZS28_011406 [Streblomastix strix]|uniref:Uncharacterized protein n=1 Tax=Streblomastix strix TaxID=222440 RepID=A0A5J4WEB1_9EUKA|nr:MAG: hypothetical protein EZS28_011406 [Streblomastix strix]